MRTRKTTSQTEAICKALVSRVEADKKVISSIAQEFNISRQAVHKHLRTLIKMGLIESYKEGKQTRYRIVQNKKKFEYPIQGLQEHTIWQEDIAPLLKALPENLQQLWQYGVTEMINNAIDHSNGSTLNIVISQTPTYTNIIIADNGEGIFRKIQRALDLTDPRQAIFELKKGKLTTDPTRHSGQGIFFTSRMADHFTICSYEETFIHTGPQKDDYFQDTQAFLESPQASVQGTVIYFFLFNTSTLTLKTLFEQYADENFDFTKTIIPLKSAQGDNALISRSQAKRVLVRVDQFKTVILDFKDVETVGQGFADEIFRVFHLQHPSIELVPINTNEAVSQMITRAILGRHQSPF